MRCIISNPKQLRKASGLIGSTIIDGTCRGNSGHRVFFYDNKGFEHICYWTRHAKTHECCRGEPPMTEKQRWVKLFKKAKGGLCIDIAELSE